MNCATIIWTEVIHGELKKIVGIPMMLLTNVMKNILITR